MKSVIDFFIQLQSQLLILHWQTQSYARHMAYGSTYKDISELADDFVEAYQGRYDRLESGKTIEFANINDDKLNTFIDECLDFLADEKKLGIKSTDTDLVSIRDDIVAKLNKLKYLMTLQ
jgi:hypothetical protein